MRNIVSSSMQPIEFPRVFVLTTNPLIFLVLGSARLVPIFSVLFFLLGIQSFTKEIVRVPESSHEMAFG